MARKLATDLKPGDVIDYAPRYITDPAHRANYRFTVTRVVIRNGFSGPFAVVVDWDCGREIYTPTARVRVA